MRKPHPSFKVIQDPADAATYRGHCPVRGDLGCLKILARRTGYRVGALADQLGVSIRTVQRAFQKKLGIPVKTWIVESRLVDICERLDEGKSIKEISCDVGFSHSKQIAREFRKTHGMTPSKYRRAERLVATKSESLSIKSE